MLIIPKTISPGPQQTQKDHDEDSHIALSLQQQPRQGLHHKLPMPTFQVELLGSGAVHTNVTYIVTQFNVSVLGKQ